MRQVNYILLSFLEYLIILSFGIKNSPKAYHLQCASMLGTAKIYRSVCNNQKDRFHPTQKPVALYKWLLDKYAKAGDKILDTHLGIGSIAIACHDYKYHLTACELDSDYFAAMQTRIENHLKQSVLF